MRYFLRMGLKPLQKAGGGRALYPAQSDVQFKNPCSGMATVERDHISLADDDRVTGMPAVSLTGIDTDADRQRMAGGTVGPKQHERIPDRNRGTRRGRMRASTKASAAASS